jgi:hypothetical protein
MNSPDSIPSPPSPDQRGGSTPQRQWFTAAGLRVALSLVFPIPGPPPAAPEAVTRCSVWLVPIGLATGLLFVTVYRGAWRFFGEVHGIRLMPAVAVWLLDVTLLGSLMLTAGSRVADRVRRTAGVNPASSCVGELGAIGLAAFIVLCVLKLMLWISIPEGVSTWPGIWGAALNFAYPHAFYRPLILAPLWGRWGVLLAIGIGRPSADADPTVSVLTAGRSWYGALLWFLPLAGLTAVYCGYNARWVLGFIIALAVMGATFLFSVIAARRLGGQSRDTVLSAGLAAELSYLILNLGLSMRIYAT